MPLEEPGPNAAGKWDFLGSQTFAANPELHALGGDLNKKIDGQLPGGKMREGQDVVLVIQT